VSAAVVATLSGCVGAPPLTIFGGLAERCFATKTTSEGYLALIGITVTNDTGRSVILRDARVVELDNATIADISVVPVPNAYTTFGFAPGGELSTDQVDLWRERSPIDGTVINARSTVEVVVELHAQDYTDYAGLRGLRLRYDDGWFSATSVADATVGFVPPWSRCGTHLN
jgi:hypothetical protein